MKEKKLDINAPSHEYLLGFFEHMTYPRAENPFDATDYAYQHDEYEKGREMAMKIKEKN